MKPLPGRILLFSISLIYFLTQCAFAHKPEEGFWTERRRAARERAVLLTRLPTGAPAAAGLLPPPLSLENKSPLAALPRHLADTLPPRFAKENAALLAALSPAHGAVRKVSLPPHGPPSRIVVHIQDVHMNAEAQTHIAETVRGLAEAGVPLSAVALEGAFGPLPLEPFRRYGDPAVIRKVADYMLRENKITGPVHAGMTGGESVPPFVGVDDRSRYDANVDAYRRSVSVQEAARDRLAGLRRELDRRKAAGLNPALARVLDQVDSYREGKTPLSAYVRTLSEAAGSAVGPQARRFLQALELETAIDLSRTEAERARLAGVLADRLTEAETDRLLRWSAAYRLGEMRNGDFYRALQSLCDGAGVSLSDFPAMASYIRYALLADRIDAEALDAELARMEKTVLAGLVRSPEEARLVRESKAAGLLGKLLAFSLTPAEWAEHQALRDALVWDGPSLEPFETFYGEAQARDHAMAANFLALPRFEKGGKGGPALPLPPLKKGGRGGFDIPVSILVTGGFHSGGIARELTLRGAAVLSYVPKIEKVDTADGPAYLSVFTRDKTPLDKLFEGDKLFVSPHPASAPHLAESAWTVGALDLTPEADKLIRAFTPKWATRVEAEEEPAEAGRRRLTIRFFKEEETPVKTISVVVDPDGEDIRAVEILEEEGDRTVKSVFKLSHRLAVALQGAFDPFGPRPGRLIHLDSVRLPKEGDVLQTTEGLAFRDQVKVDQEKVADVIPLLANIFGQPGAQADYLERIGVFAGVQGTTLYNPLGGFDSFTVRAMGPGISDFVSWGQERFGSLAELENLSGRLASGHDPFSATGGRWNGFDGTNLLQSLGSGQGLLAILKAVNYLSASLESLHYFGLSKTGDVLFDAPVQTHANAVLTFRSEDGHRWRFWYLQHDIDEDVPSFSSFVKRLSFQSAVIKAADILEEGFRKQSPWVEDLVLGPMRHQPAGTVLADALTPEGGRYPMWKGMDPSFPPRTFASERGKLFGYTGIETQPNTIAIGRFDDIRAPTLVAKEARATGWVGFWAAWMAGFAWRWALTKTGRGEFGEKGLSHFARAFATRDQGANAARAEDGLNVIVGGAVAAWLAFFIHSPGTELLWPIGLSLFWITAFILSHLVFKDTLANRLGVLPDWRKALRLAAVYAVTQILWGRIAMAAAFSSPLWALALIPAFFILLPLTRAIHADINAGGNGFGWVRQFVVWRTEFHSSAPAHGPTPSPAVAMAKRVREVGYAGTGLLRSLHLLRAMTNPFGRPLVAVYEGGSTDVLSGYLATEASDLWLTGYFPHLDPDDVRDLLSQAAQAPASGSLNPRLMFPEAAPHLIDILKSIAAGYKRQGHIPALHANEPASQAHLLVMQLWAMGFNLASIEVSGTRGRVSLRCPLPGGGHARFHLVDVFGHESPTSYPTGRGHLDLPDGVDVLLNKAPDNLSAGFADILRFWVPRLNPAGFVVGKDYRYGDVSSLPEDAYAGLMKWAWAVPGDYHHEDGRGFIVRRKPPPGTDVVPGGFAAPWTGGWHPFHAYALLDFPLEEPFAWRTAEDGPVIAESGTLRELFQQMTEAAQAEGGPARASLEYCIRTGELARYLDRQIEGLSAEYVFTPLREWVDRLLVDAPSRSQTQEGDKTFTSSGDFARLLHFRDSLLTEAAHYPGELGDVPKKVTNPPSLNRAEGWLGVGAAWSAEGAVALTTDLLTWFGITLAHAGPEDRMAPDQNLASATLGPLADIFMARRNAEDLFRQQWIPFWRTFISQQRLLSISAGEALGKVALASGKWNKPHMIRSLCLPLYDGILAGGETPALRGLAMSLGDLADGMAARPESVPLLETEWPRVLQAILRVSGDMNTRMDAIDSLGRLARTLATLPNAKTLFASLWLPLYREMVVGGRKEGGRAAKSLFALAEAIAKRSEAEELFRDIFGPAYELAMTQDDDVRKVAVDSLAIAAQSLAAHPEADHLLQALVYDRIESLLSDPETSSAVLASVAYSLISISDMERQRVHSQADILRIFSYCDRLLGATSDDSVHSDVAYVLDPLGKWIASQADADRLLRDRWTPLFLRLATKDEPPLSPALRSLGRTSAALVLRKDGPHFLSFYKRRFNDVMKANIMDRRLTSLAESLGMVGAALMRRPDALSLLTREWAPLFDRLLAHKVDLKWGIEQCLWELAFEVGEKPDLPREIGKFVLAMHRRANMPSARLEAPAVGPSSLAARIRDMANHPNPMPLLLEEALPEVEDQLRQKDFPVNQSGFPALQAFLEALPRNAAPLPTDFRRLSDVLPRWVSSPESPDYSNHLLTNAAVTIARLAGANGNDLWPRVVPFLRALRAFPSVGLEAGRTLRFILLESLAAKGQKLNVPLIQKVYRSYFETEDVLPAGNSPKTLLAHILLDDVFRLLGLPQAYGKALRSGRRSPGHLDILPLIEKILNGEPLFAETIAELSSRRISYPDDYWRAIHGLLAVVARHWDSLDSLGLLPQVKDRVRSAVGSTHGDGKTAGTKPLQTAANDIGKLLAESAGKAFHLSIDQPQWKALTPDELRVVAFVSGHPEAKESYSVVNRALRPYFAARLRGGTKEQALAAFHANLIQLPVFPALLAPLAPFLDERGTGLRSPPPMNGRVVVSHAGLRERKIWESWGEALDHLREIARDIPPGAPRTSLEGLLEGLPKPLSEKDIPDLLRAFEKWLADHDRAIPESHRQWVAAIQRHFDDVRSALAETQGEQPASLSDAVSREVEIYAESDPVKVLHLGWPRLGGSCLDLTHCPPIGGYILTPSLRVLFIRNGDRPDKPMARVVVALDPETRTLFTISRVKTSSPYNFQPLIGAYLRAWADEEGLTVTAARDLGFDESLGPGFTAGTRSVSLPSGLASFHADYGLSGPPVTANDFSKMPPSPKRTEMFGLVYEGKPTQPSPTRPDVSHATGWLGLGAAQAAGWVWGVALKVAGRGDKVAGGVRAFAREFATRDHGINAARGEDGLNTIVGLGVALWLALLVNSPGFGLSDLIGPALASLVWLASLVLSHAFGKESFERILHVRPDVSKAIRLSGVYAATQILLAGIGLAAALSSFWWILALLPTAPTLFWIIRRIHDDMNAGGSGFGWVGGRREADPWFSLQDVASGSLDRAAVFERLLTHLRTDFKGRQGEGEAPASCPEPGELQTFLRERTPLDGEELAVRAGARIHLPSYIAALGFLLKDGETAPGAGDLARRIADAVLPAASSSRRLALTHPARLSRLHHRANAALKAWPLVPLYRGKKANGDLQNEGDDRDNAENRAKIKNALGLLRAEADPQSTDPFPQALPDLLDALTILQVDSPIPLLFADYAYGVVRPMNIGRHGNVLYVSKRFIEDFEISEAELKELSAHLRHQIQWMQLFAEMDGKADPEDIGESLLRHTLSFPFHAGLDGTTARAVQDRFSRLMRIQAASEAEQIVPLFLARHAALKENEEKFKQPTSVPDDRTKRKTALLALIAEADRLSAMAQVLGDGAAAAAWKDRCLRHVEELEMNETGIQPITANIAMLGTLLSLGYYPEMLGKLESLLSGKGFGFPDGSGDGAAKNHQDILRITAKPLGAFADRVDNALALAEQHGDKTDVRLLAAAARLLHDHLANESIGSEPLSPQAPVFVRVADRLYESVRRFQPFGNRRAKPAASPREVRDTPLSALTRSLGDFGRTSWYRDLAGPALFEYGYPPFRAVVFGLRVAGVLDRQRERAILQAYWKSVAGPPVSKERAKANVRWVPLKLALVVLLTVLFLWLSVEWYSRWGMGAAAAGLFAAWESLSRETKIKISRALEQAPHLMKRLPLILGYRGAPVILGAVAMAGGSLLFPAAGHIAFNAAGVGFFYLFISHRPAHAGARSWLAAGLAGYFSLLAAAATGEAAWALAPLGIALVFRALDRAESRLRRWAPAEDLTRILLGGSPVTHPRAFLRLLSLAEQLELLAGGPIRVRRAARGAGAAVWNPATESALPVDWRRGRLRVAGREMDRLNLLSSWFGDPVLAGWAARDPADLVARSGPMLSPDAGRAPSVSLTREEALDALKASAAFIRNGSWVNGAPSDLKALAFHHLSLLFFADRILGDEGESRDFRRLASSTLINELERGGELAVPAARLLLRGARIRSSGTDSPAPYSAQELVIAEKMTAGETLDRDELIELAKNYRRLLLSGKVNPTFVFRLSEEDSSSVERLRATLSSLRDLTSRFNGHVTVEVLPKDANPQEGVSELPREGNRWETYILWEGTKRRYNLAKDEAVPDENLALTLAGEEKEENTSAPVPESARTDVASYLARGGKVNIAFQSSGDMLHLAVLSDDKILYQRSVHWLAGNSVPEMQLGVLHALKGAFTRTAKILNLKPADIHALGFSISGPLAPGSDRAGTRAIISNLPGFMRGHLTDEDRAAGGFPIEEALREMLDNQGFPNVRVVLMNNAQAAVMGDIYAREGRLAQAAPPEDVPYPGEVGHTTVATEGENGVNFVYSQSLEGSPFATLNEGETSAEFALAGPFVMRRLIMNLKRTRSEDQIAELLDIEVKHVQSVLDGAIVVNPSSDQEHPVYFLKDEAAVAAVGKAWASVLNQKFPLNTPPEDLVAFTRQIAQETGRFLKASLFDRFPKGYEIGVIMGRGIGAGFCALEDPNAPTRVILYGGFAENFWVPRRDEPDRALSEIAQEAGVEADRIVRSRLGYTRDFYAFLVPSLLTPPDFVLEKGGDLRKISEEDTLWWLTLLSSLDREVAPDSTPGEEPAINFFVTQGSMRHRVATLNRGILILSGTVAAFGEDGAALVQQRDGKPHLVLKLPESVPPPPARAESPALAQEASSQENRIPLNSVLESGVRGWRDRGLEGNSNQWSRWFYHLGYYVYTTMIDPAWEVVYRVPGLNGIVHSFLSTRNLVPSFQSVIIKDKILAVGVRALGFDPDNLAVSDINWIGIGCAALSGAILVFIPQIAILAVVPLLIWMHLSGLVFAKAHDPAADGSENNDVQEFREEMRIYAHHLLTLFFFFPLIVFALGGEAFVGIDMRTPLQALAIGWKVNWLLQGLWNNVALWQRWKNRDRPYAEESPNAKGRREGNAAARVFLSQELAHGERAALLLPPLDAPGLDSEAPQTQAAARWENADYRNGFINGFRGTILQNRKTLPTVGEILGRQVDLAAASEAKPAEERNAVTVFEEIVTAQDVPAVAEFLETLSRHRSEDRTIMVRLIPGEKGAKSDLKALAEKHEGLASFHDINLETSALENDFTSWWERVNQGQGSARLILSLSDGVSVVGEMGGNSLYRRALRAALEGIPLRPADWRDYMEIAEAVGSSA